MVHGWGGGPLHHWGEGLPALLPRVPCLVRHRWCLTDTHHLTPLGHALGCLWGPSQLFSHLTQPFCIESLQAISSHSSPSTTAIQPEPDGRGRGPHAGSASASGFGWFWVAHSNAGKAPVLFWECLSGTHFSQHHPARWLVTLLGSQLVGGCDSVLHGQDRPWPSASPVLGGWVPCFCFSQQH